MSAARTKRKKKTTAKKPRALTFAEQTSVIDDASGPMGIRLVAQNEAERAPTTIARLAAPTLILPVHAGIAELTLGSAKHLVDKASWVLVPAGARVVIRAKSPTAHTMLLAISVPLRAAVTRAYGGEIQLVRFDRYVSEVQVMARTNWVNELCHRYLFERAVCKKAGNVATAFLEMEIVKELYFVCHERATAKERTSVVETRTDLVQRAMTIVEEHLFEPDVVQRLMRGSGASASSLLRTFKREVGQGPQAYVRARRLDESLLLLKSKRFAVGEVATMVGYKNFAAFSQAFRARFGSKPSEVAAH